MSGVARLLLIVGFLSLPSGRAGAQVPDPEIVDEPLVEPAVPIEVPKIELPKTELVDPKSVEPGLERAFEPKSGFCKSADHELTPSEAALCDLGPAAKGRCPGFVLACERLAASERRERHAAGSSTDGERNRSRGDRRHSDRGHGSGSEEREGSADGSTWETSSSPFGEFLGKIVTVIVWGLLAVGIGAMLIAGIRALLGRRRDPDAAPESKSPATVERVVQKFPTGSPEELLERARELAGRGELKAAMAVVLRALLRHLEIGGALELHPSRTNGDYVRSLRRGGHRPDELRRVAAEVEAIEFGGGQPSPEGFSALHARVSKVVHVASLTLLCLSLGFVTGCRKRTPPDDTMSSCGSSASGYSALCETLASRGVKVRRRFTSVEKVAPEVTRVVVLEDEIDETERQMLLAWTAQGGTLVVFDPSKTYNGLVSTLNPPCGDELTLDPDFWNVPPGKKSGLRLPKARAFDGQGGVRRAVRCQERPFVVQSGHGDGTILAIADGRLPMNASLAIEENAALVTALVAPPGATVELIGGWTGTGTDLPLESLTRSGLLPWFLHVLVLGFVIALYRGAPFGTRREPATVTRRAFAEHAIALGDAYSRVRASRIALVNYGSYALERLRVRLQETKHGRLTDLAGAIAARHQVSEAEVMSLVVAVRSAEDQAHDSANEQEHLLALRRLAALVKKTGGSS